MNLQSKITASFIALLVVIGLGTVGYALVEHWPIHDALYMTMITISTVGFGEVRNLSESGRLLTIGLIIASISIGGYAITNITSYFVSGELVTRIRYRRMYRKIQAMKKHVIIAGYGKLGREIAEELQRLHTSFCIVEQDPDRAATAREQGHAVIEGDASRDEILEQAGVRHAYGLVTALTGDAANVMVTITAREMNPGLYIVARGIDDHSQAKLQRAGADRVELPFKISGRRISALIVKPGIVDFIDLFSRTFSDDLLMVQLDVSDESQLLGKTLKELDLRRVTGGLVIMAVLRSDESLIVHPDGDTAFRGGDRLLVLGSQDQISRFQIEYHVTETTTHAGGFNIRHANIKHGAQS